MVLARPAIARLTFSRRKGEGGSEEIKKKRLEQSCCCGRRGMRDPCPKQELYIHTNWARWIFSAAASPQLVLFLVLAFGHNALHSSYSPPSYSLMRTRFVYVPRTSFKPQLITWVGKGKVTKNRAVTERAGLRSTKLFMIVSKGDKKRNKRTFDWAKGSCGRTFYKILHPS